MDIRDAARYFNDDPVYDAYTGALLFYCHTTPHDDHTSSGATARRRSMITAADTVAPARHAVTIYGEAWIVGNSNPDGFQGVQIRRSYGLKKSTGLVDLLTPGQACLGAAGTPFHAHKEYFRDMQEAHTASDWDTMWNIFCPPGEAVTAGVFLRQGGSLMRVRNAYLTMEELIVAETDQLDADALQSATFTSAVLDLATDSTTETDTPVPVIQTDMAKFFRYRTLAEADLQPGDRTVFVPASSYTPKTGELFLMQGARWRVVTAVPELDSFAVHARLA